MLLSQAFLAILLSLALSASVADVDSMVVGVQGETKRSNNVVMDLASDTEDLENDKDEETSNSTSSSTDLPPFKFPTIDDTIKDYLNPRLFRNPIFMSEIKQGLRAGKAVVIKNAFREDFAEAMHAELLANLDNFKLHTVYEEDHDFSCHHHNIYDLIDYTPLMNATRDMMNSWDTLDFMSELSGRNCESGTDPTASWYKVGDHSLPHTDHWFGRTLAYVWHLSKDWKDGYGGHLYWMNEHASNAFLAASFNTLVLFSVTPLSHHMVTSVTPLAEGHHRLTINGWFEDNWIPSWQEDDWEYDYETEEDMLHITDSQYIRLQDMTAQCLDGELQLPPDEDIDLGDALERCEAITELTRNVIQLFDPEHQEVQFVKL